MAKEKIKKVEIVNRKAKFEYKLLDFYEAGLMLTGTEVKSLRNGEANLTDAFCFFRKGELFVKNLFIAEYKLGTHYNHEPRRLRKLLLHRQELKKLNRRVTEKGFTIVPYRLYFNERGFAKLEVALAQGKASYDKRNTIRERDNKRELARMKKMKL